MTPRRLAYLSLIRHPFATVITAIAVGLAVACGGILLRLHNLSESRFQGMGLGGDAIVGAKAGGIDILLGSLNGEGTYPGFLPYKLFETLRAEATVTHSDGVSTRPTYIESIIPFLYFGKLDGYRAVGTDESFFQRPRKEDELSLAAGTIFSKPFEVVLGATVARDKHLGPGDQIKIQSWTGDGGGSIDIPVTVVGVLKPTNSQWDRQIYASVLQAQQTLDQHFDNLRGKSIWGAQVLNYFLVYLQPNGYAELESLVNRRTVGQVINVDEQKARLQELTGAGTSIGLFVTVFVILLGGLSVGAVLITRFEGMTIQLAVSRALGYTRSEIARWLMWEGFLIGLVGVILGAVLDLCLFPVLRSLLGSALPPADLISIPLYQSAVIWMMALAATISSVFIPIVRISRQDTHHSLRGL